MLSAAQAMRLARHALAVVRAWRMQRGGGARLALALLALSLGVGLAFAIHIVNGAALAEFTTGLRSLAGGADLVVSGPARGFSAEVYARVASDPGVAAASPVVEIDARVPAAATSIRIMGLDVFRVGAIQPALIGIPVGEGTLDTLRPDALFLAEPLFERLQVKPGDTLELESGVGRVTVRIAGTLGADIRRTPVAVMDIAGAHALAGDTTAIMRIDVRVRPGVAPARLGETLQRSLPAGVTVGPAADLGIAETQLSRSYRVNLTVLALVALFTGSLLVFSTQALAVVRRRTEFALLRTLGLTPRELLARLIGEATVFGAIGSFAGLLVGWILAWAVVRYLGADLGAGFFRGVRPELVFSPMAAVGFFALGVLAAILGAVGPALEAAQAPPARALKAGDDEQVFARIAAAWPGLAAIALGAVGSFAPPVNELPLFGYASIALILIGVILLMPRVAALAVRALPVGHRVPFALAVAQLRGAPGQPAVSLSAIVGAVSLAVSMAIMVASFRGSLDDWLHKLLPADLYLRAGGAGSSSTGFIDPAMQAVIAALPGVGRVEFLRSDALVLDPQRPRLTLLAREIAPRDPGARLPLVREANLPPDDVLAVWITEAASEIHRLEAGMRFELPLAGVRYPAVVAGVWRDYGRQGGAVVIARSDYERITGDKRANDGAIWLAREEALAMVRSRLETLAPGLEVATPGEIRRVSLAVFDRTFAVTYGLEAVAIVIGLAGLAASFGALVLARRREFGVLRHLGVTNREIVAMLAAQGAIIAGIGVLTGLVAGFLISLILIYVVNWQSFRWGMTLYIPWVALALFSLALAAAAVITAMLSGRGALAGDSIRAVKDDW